MHAVPLVSVPIGRAAVRDLFEQRIDLSSARQRDRVQQVRGCVPVCGGLVQTRSLHSSSFFPSVRRARNKWLRTAGTLLRVTSATSA